MQGEMSFMKRNRRILSKKGSTLVMMVVMVSVLTIIGFTLLFIVLGFFNMNKLYQASEDLNYETERVGQVISQKLVEKVSSIIAGVAVQDGTNISQDTLKLIHDKYDNSTHLQSLTDPIHDDGAPYDNLNTRLTNILDSASLSAGQKSDFLNALKDISFKLAVEAEQPNSILSNNNAQVLARVKDGGYFDDVTDSSGNLIFTLTDHPSASPPYSALEIDKTQAVPGEVWNWLKDRLNDDECDSYVDYPVGDQYGKIKYTVTTENEKLSYKKRMEFTFETTYTTFSPSSVLTANSWTINSYTNEKFSKVLAATGNITIQGVGAVALDGNVYAFGVLPTTMNDNIIPPTSFGGVIFDSDNQNVNINGNVITRGYLKANGGDSTINIRDSAICDTLLLAEDKSNIVLNIGTDLNNHSLSTFDDIRVNSPQGSSVRIKGNFYGLNDGSSGANMGRINKSSSIILNTLGNSYIRIDGQALIGGVAYASNITKNSYAFKTGESVAIGDNFKVYSYKLDQATDPDDIPTNASTPPYSIDQTNDFQTWNVANVSGIGFTQAVLLDPDYINPNSPAKTGNLKSHFYHYVKLHNTDADRNLLFPFNPSNTGIILNANKSHYAPGIICAQAYQDSNNDGEPDSGAVPATGAFYLLNESLPSPLPSGFSSFNVPAMSEPEYITKIGTEKQNAIKEISFIKKYNDIAAEPNTGETKEAEYTDSGGKLNPAVPNYIQDINSDYFYYIANEKKDIVIGDSTDYPNGKIDASSINNHSGIIYTKGNITIQPSASFTFRGVIIANGIYTNPPDAGNILIKSSSGVTIDNTNIETVYNKPFFAPARRFFAPGNIGSASVTSTDVYSSANKNVRLVDKRLVRQ